MSEATDLKGATATEMVGTSYPWHLLARTILLTVSFLVLGVMATIHGPALLDLKDLLAVSVGDVSFMFMFNSLGGLVGCALIGVLFDRFKSFSYLICGVLLMLSGLMCALFPYSATLPALYTIAFVFGSLTSAYDSAGQVVLLDVWKGRDSGPYMHALHFMFGMGAFISPLLAEPFLFNSPDLDVHALHQKSGSNLSRSNFSQSEAASNGTDHGSSALEISEYYSENIWTIRALYPLVAVLPVLCSLVFTLLFCFDFGKKTSEKSEKEKEEAKKAGQLPTGRSLVVVGAMALFFFLYVGQEVAYGTFITTFSVKSDLDLSRQDGAYVTAIFWGAFAFTRGLAIPAAIFFSPQSIMILSCGLSIAGSGILAVWGSGSWQVFYVCTAVMGIGMASIFATGLLWLEKHVKMNSRVLSIMVVAGALGAKVFPVTVGQTIEDTPNSFLYINLGIALGCSALFLTSSLVARTIRLDKDEVYATVSLNDKADRNTGSNLDDSEIASSGDEGKRAMMSLDEVKNGTMNSILTDDES